MPPLIALVAGFAMLAIFILLGRASRRVACYGFIAAWLALCVAHFTYATRVAAFGFQQELAVHAGVFGLPALTALILARVFRARPPR
ncbi:hypothetical protein CEG14_19420 [Bordetella genomosp. 1]|uniref:Uncharacterized protein n=1 Tax=Bordetella genomosp. 1 TaxID=1395607 RepID=A0A261S7E3_9BORD|nr:hypothetical protein [Bordetella genomosp. 1]OZI33031.1 hypothetical protein CEG14_19420 [Bordetella genomosp. 1]